MRALVMAAGLVLAACGPIALSGGKTEDAPAETAEAGAEGVSAENACPASAVAAWSGLVINASASGESCATAQASISIRDGAGAEILAQTYPAEQVMTLAGAESVEDLQRRLTEWITPAGAAPDSTGDLPEWAANEPNPMSGEFPFYVEEGVDRASYEALRGRNALMYCYVQGMESQACWALENGRFTKIGVQSFPG